MFEFLIQGHEEGPRNENSLWFHGTTTDFLEVICQIAQKVTPGVAGDFVTALAIEKEDELDFLRIAPWEFEFENDLIKIRLDKRM